MGGRATRAGGAGSARREGAQHSHSCWGREGQGAHAPRRRSECSIARAERAQPGPETARALHPRLGQESGFTLPPISHASLCPRPPGPPASGAPARSRGRCPCLPEGGRGHGRTEQACGPPAPSAHRDGDRSCARPWPCGRGALPALCCALAGLPRSHRLLAYLVRQQAPFPPSNLPWVGLLTPPALVLTWVVSHTPPCPPRAPGAHPGCHLSRG